MQITITIPQVLVDTVAQYATERTGRPTSAQQVQDFFAADVEAMYCCPTPWNQRSLREGVDAFFYAAE